LLSKFNCTATLRHAHHYSSTRNAPFENDYTNPQYDEGIHPAAEPKPVEAPWEAAESGGLGIQCTGPIKAEREFDEGDKRSYAQELLQQINDQKLNR
jgi:hypothetical protein